MPVSMATFMGGAVEEALTAARTIYARTQRLWLFTPDAPARIVTLTPLVTMRLGGPQFVVGNLGADTITVEDESTTTIATLLVDEIAIFSVSLDSGGSRVWIVQGPFPMLQGPAS